MKHILITTIAAVVLVGCGPRMSIHEAAYEGNIEAVKQHLAAGVDVNAKNDSENTPLHRAALKGHKEVAELLLAEGADVNAKNKRYMTPLHLAARSGRKEIVELLITAGADVNAKDEDGKTPLDDANEGPFLSPEDKAAKKEIATLLRKHGGKLNSIHAAARAGNDEAVKEFLAAGADVNAKDKKGGTPLDWAIGLNHTKTANLLRKHGGKTGEELKAEGK